MNIIDGKAFAEKIREKVKSQVKILKQNHNISINVFDILGRQVSRVYNGELQRGEHNFNLSEIDYSINYNNSKLTINKLNLINKELFRRGKV